MKKTLPYLCLLIPFAAAVIVHLVSNEFLGPTRLFRPGEVFAFVMTIGPAIQLTVIARASQRDKTPS